LELELEMELELEPDPVSISVQRIPLLHHPVNYSTMNYSTYTPVITSSS